jgi:hypothetical protein
VAHGVHLDDEFDRQPLLSNYSAIDSEAEHVALNNCYHLFLIPSSVDEKRSARINIATAISHAESGNFARIKVLSRRTANLDCRVTGN